MEEYAARLACLVGEITKEEYIQQKNTLKDRQHELASLISAYDKVDDEFINTMNRLIEVASNALDAFRGSKIEEKRKILKMVFSNQKLEGAKLVYSWATPFDLIEKMAICPAWLPGPEIVRTIFMIKSRLIQPCENSIIIKSMLQITEQKKDNLSF